MKKVLAILILSLLAGCTGTVKAPAAASPAPVVTASPAAVVTATAAPTAQAEQQITIGVSATATAAPKETPAPTAEPTAAPTSEPTATPEPTAEPGPLAGFVVGLGPGHQLVYDPAPEPVAPGARETKQKVAGGCRGVRSGVYEYEVNLDVSLKLRDLLQAAGATVIMTHKVLDVNISNIQRAQMFNEAQVDLGIRIHCNRADDRKQGGAFMIVPTENRTKFYEDNLRAARTILAAYCQETGLTTRYKEGITYRSDQTGFNWCERPIVAIEMGHLSNPTEDALLSDPDFQIRMARGLFNGILQYLRPDLMEVPQA